MNSFANFIERHKFTLLLLLLVFVQIVPVVQGTPNEGLAGVMWGLVMLAAINAVAETRRRALLFAAIAIVTFGGRIASAFGPREAVVVSVEAGTFVVGSMFLAMTIYVVMRAVLKADRIRGDTVRGAICVYLMIGYMWANFYSIVELTAPGSFNFPDYARPTAGSVIPEYTFGYYSFVTLTTLGYGDITPISYRARTLSWMEAVVGVAFMATTIAFLISQVVVDRREGREL